MGQQMFYSCGAINSSWKMFVVKRGRVTFGVPLFLSLSVPFDTSESECYILMFQAHGTISTTH